MATLPAKRSGATDQVMPKMATPAQEDSMVLTSEWNRHDTHFIDILPAAAIPVVHGFFHVLEETGESFFLRDQIETHLAAYLHNAVHASQRSEAGLKRLFRGCQEIILWQGYTYATLRPRIGTRRIVRLHPDESRFEEVSAEHYLEVKDAYVQGVDTAAVPGLHIDFSAFFREYPRVKDPQTMGRGMSVLNAYLSGQMSQNPRVFQRALQEYLSQCSVDGVNILMNDHIRSPAVLLEELDRALTMLSDLEPEMPYSDFSHDLRSLGFEPGWGSDAATVTEGLTMLSDVLENADAERFERLLGRLPIARNLLMVSPHGWFAQNDVLGKPDTGGQVTYVLDQARALERRMIERFAACGVDATPRILILTRLIPDAEGTSCGDASEKVLGSENCWIVRVPFRDGDGMVVPHWISRFKIWPYLERFARESVGVVTREFMNPPDLIIGHYSDGNLVAHLMADTLGVTHCACVHALEKTKYLFSDMRWADMEQDYHFSLQFTADVLAYNSADYIVSSSYREIVGTETEMGMFESYETFSLPGLYRVVGGMDPQLARYNIVPPGVSEEYFYPYAEIDRRVPAIIDHLNETIFGAQPGPDAVGELENPMLPPIFAMSRVDRVKNLPGLVEAFGMNADLQRYANLVILSSITDAAQSSDPEEIEQIHRIYALIDEYNLHKKVRWAGVRLGKAETGEVYRVAADRGGVFAQPAFMETFGLTVIEAMACGLPVVATCFGGPAEIVVPEESGLVANPNHHDEFSGALLRCFQDQDLWKRLSNGGVERVDSAYRWSAHATSLLNLANVYSYWNYLDVMNRNALDQYIHTLFHAVYSPRAQAME